MTSHEEIKTKIAAGIQKLSEIGNEDTVHDARNAAITTALELLSDLRGPEEQFLHLSYAVSECPQPSWSKF